MEAKAIVKALKEDKEALKELAEELVSVHDIRLAIINAIIKDVATKQDVKESEDRIRNYVDARVNDLNRRMDDLNRKIDNLKTTIQIGFTILGIMITGLSLFLAYLIKL